MFNSVLIVQTTRQKYETKINSENCLIRKSTDHSGVLTLTLGILRTTVLSLHFSVGKYDSHVWSRSTHCIQKHSSITYRYNEFLFKSTPSYFIIFPHGPFDYNAIMKDVNNLSTHSSHHPFFPHGIENRRGIALALRPLLASPLRNYGVVIKNIHHPNCTNKKNPWCLFEFSYSSGIILLCASLLLPISTLLNYLPYSF